MKQFLCTLLVAASLICQVSAQTQFAIMSFTPEQSQADAKLMGVTFIRNHVAMQTGNGIKKMDGQFGYFTNFVYNNSKFPTSIASYEKELRTTINSMPVRPSLAVIENEENMNPNVGTYCDMLVKADAVFAEKRIQITNGGITDGAAVALACDYYNSIGDKATASYLASRNKKGTVIMVQRAKTIIATLQKLRNCAGFNFHYQLKDKTYTTDLLLIIVALEKLTGLPIINNELAQRDYSTETTTGMIQTAKRMRFVGLYITTGAAGNASTFTLPMKQAAASAIK